MDFPLYFQKVMLLWQGSIVDIDYGFFRVFGPYFIGKSLGTFKVLIFWLWAFIWHPYHDVGLSAWWACILWGWIGHCLCDYLCKVLPKIYPIYSCPLYTLYSALSQLTAKVICFLPSRGSSFSHPLVDTRLSLFGILLWHYEVKKSSRTSQKSLHVSISILDLFVSPYCPSRRLLIGQFRSVLPSWANPTKSSYS